VEGSWPTLSNTIIYVDLFLGYLITMFLLSWLHSVELYKIIMKKMRGV